MRKKIIFGIVGILVIFFIIAAISDSGKDGTSPPAPPPGPIAAGCAEQNDEDDPAAVAAWRSLKERAFKELVVSRDWKSSELVQGAVNTLGWEDSINISADGSTLSFVYFRGNLFRIAEVFQYHTPKTQGGGGADPANFSKFHKGPSRNVSPPYSADMLSTTRNGDLFCDVARFPWSRDNASEWGAMQAADGAWYYVFDDPVDGKEDKDIYRNGVALAIPGRERFKEDDPHFIVTEHGRELFFWSDNRVPEGGRSFVTREIGDNRWSEPEELAGPAGVQPHLTTDGILYFTSTKDGTLAIWRAKRLGRNSWAEPEKVIGPSHAPGPGLWGVGEPTVTADGKWLYFVAVFQNNANDFDADAGRVMQK